MRTLVSWLQTFQSVLHSSKDPLKPVCPAHHVLCAMLKGLFLSLPFLHPPLLDVMVKSCNPVVFSFYNYLRTHPLIIRRHFANPEGTATTVGLTAEKSSADEINLIERKLFFTTANAHFKVSSSIIWTLFPIQFFWWSFFIYLSYYSFFLFHFILTGKTGDKSLFLGCALCKHLNMYSRHTNK